MKIIADPYLSIQMDNNKGEKLSYKREKTYRYNVYFQFENGTKVSTEFSVRFIETEKGDFVKRRTYWKKSEMPNLLDSEKGSLNAEIRKYAYPDKGEIQHINSNRDEFENPTDDSFFGNFLIG